jgi:hypothetical protein
MAYQFTAVFRRPNPERVEDIGLWQDVMGMMCTAAILTNAGILVFTSNSFHELSVEMRCVVFLGLVQALLAVQALVEALVPTETPTLREVIGRHEYLIEKHIHGFQVSPRRWPGLVLHVLAFNSMAFPAALSQDMAAASSSTDKGDGKGGKGADGDDSTKRGHIDLGALEEQLLKKAESANAKDLAGLLPEMQEVKKVSWLPCFFWC